MAEGTNNRKVIPAKDIMEKIQRGEDVEYDDKVIDGDLDIRKLNLPRDANEKVRIDSEIQITNSQIDGVVNFESAIFWRVDFSGTRLTEFADFLVAEFSRADFEGTWFCKNSQFLAVTFYQYGNFKLARFCGCGDFEGSMFGSASFSESKFNDDADFRDVTFNHNVNFSGAKFSKDASFMRTNFEAESVSFKGTKFAHAEDQEYACRRAKNVLAKAGNRDAEEYHFYREMEAKRVRKGIRGNSGLGLVDCLKTDTWSFWRYFFHDAIEWIFVQMMFGYGVHFERLIASWAIIVVLFAGLYYHSDVISGVSNAFDCLKVSFATAIAPGYIAIIINPGNSTGGYRITSGYYQAAAMVEMLFGTFLWAGFIATFAKKYMR